MDSRKLARLCRELADNRKAEKIVILDLRKLTSITDYFVLATGTSAPHVRAIVDEISDQIHLAHDLKPRAMDGAPGSAWVVLDYESVIVHIMRPETRAHYDLEGFWNDAPRVKTRVRKTGAQ